ncbi:MAG: DNA mismatch endonuclease Vsr [Mariprofundaceae bacterium]|nr:DNA mismatch endonuclease Vsr [Mariprofundaceae bacterium]
MVDNLSRDHRSWNMGRIKSVDTGPEMIVRSCLHQRGYRFRLHGKVSKRLHPKGVLPGKPDIVLAGYRTVIFVHGCFWHRHPGCVETTTPKTRTEWWTEKFEKNMERDRRKYLELERLGWKILIVWGCEVEAKRLDGTMDKLEGGIQPE